MDSVEKNDVRNETLKIFTLELDVAQRSEGGKLGETIEWTDGCVACEGIGAKEQRKIRIVAACV